MNGYLHRFVAVSDHYPAGTCWAWMDTAERVCGKPEGNQAAHLCNRHADVALRKAHAVVVVERARAERLRVAMVEKAPVALPRLRAELARVEAEMARRDPQPVTTDRAAYGGAVHRSIARAARGRLSDSNVARMAELVDQAARLRGKIAGYEAAVVAR